MNPAPFSPLDLLPDASHSALLVIDVQERLVSAMPADVMPGVLRNIGIMIETAREFSLPVVLSEQYPKGLGATDPAIRAALPADLAPREKLAFSCCREPAFDSEWQALGERDLILCGVETHVCVLQTTLDLLAQGRRVFVAADACCSRSRHNWQLGLDLMRQAGAVVGSVEIFAFGLLRSAGSERFKRISKLVK